jgi:predicted RNase H-like nuclease
MPVVLGIDAAWTAAQPSGVALLKVTQDSVAWLAAAPSYTEFLEQAHGRRTDWSAKVFAGCSPDVYAILQAAHAVAGQPVDVVAVDMPISKRLFCSRRPADDRVSVEFGSRWCAAHTPNRSRPGELGVALTAAFRSGNFALKAVGDEPSSRSLIEVYPHVALLSLLKRSRRIPYKVSKSRKYWPQASIAERIALLLEQFGAILAALADELGPVELNLPSADTVVSLSTLKRYEDVLDALVCAWAGLEFLKGRTTPLGDEDAAVWCPTDVIGHCLEGPGRFRSPHPCGR